MVRRSTVAFVVVLLVACSSPSPVVRRPAGTPSASVSAPPKPSTSASPAPSPTPTTPGAHVYDLEQGQATLEITGDFPFAGTHVLDRGFSAPPSGGEKDGTYGWLSSNGDTLVLNVPASGPWTVSGRMEGTEVAFDQCAVKVDRNDPGGLAGSLRCNRVTRAGTVAPAGTAAATFNLEP